MNTGLIPVRYATALLDFAKQAGTSDDVYNEAKTLTHLFAGMTEIRRALENPVVPLAEKRQLILNAAGGNPSETFRKFTELLLHNKRETAVQSIMLKFIELYRKEKNIRYGKLTTAQPVDESTEQRLMHLITANTGGTVELEKEISPHILGGFILQVDDARWDASIAGQLKAIKKEYIERNKRIV